MPGFPMGYCGNVPSTWSAYGKAWDEWVAVVGDRHFNASEMIRLQVTMDLLSSLQERGVSVAVAQRRMAGVRFHLKLRGWADALKDFIVRQALKGGGRSTPIPIADASYIFLFAGSVIVSN